MTGCPPPCVPLRGRPTTPQVVIFWMECSMINIITKLETKRRKIPLKIANLIDNLDLMKAEPRGKVPKLEAAGPLDGTKLPLDSTRTIRLTIETLRIKESLRTPNMSLETDLIILPLLPQVKARRQDRRGRLGWSPWAPPRLPGSPPVLLSALRSGRGGVTSWSSQRGA